MPASKTLATAGGETSLKVQVIARAAKILKSLENEPNGLSLGQIALQVELPRSTVQRIVKALSNEQFLISATPTSKVKLGPALIRLARATNLGISQFVKPYLESLGRSLEETIDLSVMEGSGAVFLDQIPGSHRLRAVSAIGERFPLHCTACGKSLLATLPTSNLYAFLDTTLESFTPNTITTRGALKKEIDKIRSTGVALDDEEHTEGISAVSVSFEDPVGRVYAISIPAPTTRFKRDQKKFRNALVECRNVIVAELNSDRQNKSG